MKINRLALLLLSGMVGVQAGAIQGVVIEHLSGRPIARTLVRLDPVPKAGTVKAQTRTMRVGLSGQFIFSPIDPGMYLLTAVRDGYFPAAYGQRLPVGRGTPIEVTDDSKLFAELRLRHKGAITGRVLDENGVVASGISVVAYSARLPLRSAGIAVSDDRGMYRIHGLDPGKYWVRSAAQTLEDGSGWLPTFGPLAREVREARIHRVTVDADTADADISPEPGALFRLGGVVTCDTDLRIGVIVTLSSETGRKRSQTSCPKGGYLFDGLAPGVYEVFAMREDNMAAGFLELFVDHNMDSGHVQVLQLPTIDIEVRRAGSSSAAGIPVTLVGHRQDLSETETENVIKMPRTTLAPGHWEFRARVPSGQFVESITNLQAAPRRPWKAERDANWYDTFVDSRGYSRIRITVSDHAAQVAGQVLSDSKPVPGVPVFLWPVAEPARRSLSGYLQTLCDTDGRFRFDSLPPGDYRALSSFDVIEIDEDLIELSRAGVIHLEASQTASIELKVWIAPW